MTFDPFGDFETRGYLQNTAGEKDLQIIKRIEHRSFLANLDRALADLSKIPEICYKDVLGTHKTLFGAVYPWAGQDRQQLLPDKAVVRGDVKFSHPQDAQAATEYALELAQKKQQMASRPGEVMGHLAYGHPFLDGNGRTIMVVHAVLSQRAGISIDWAATDKTKYLDALAREIEAPGKHLDVYLKPHLGPPIALGQLANHLVKAKGLDGASQSEDANKVAGKIDDPALQASYRAQQLSREASLKNEGGRADTDAVGDDQRAAQKIPPRGRGGRD